MILKTPLWKRTPPAIFPVCLGYAGLAIAWLNGADYLPFPRFIGEVLLGVSIVFFLYFLAFYIAKLIARPSVLLEDVRMPPLRAGIAAIPMTILLLSAALYPISEFAPVVWWVGVVLQVGATIAVLYAIWKDPAEKRSFNTFMYLTFVGPLTSAAVGIKLGYGDIIFWLTMASFTAFLVITTGFARSFFRTRLPHPLRPSLAILLAPVSLLALSFGQLGMGQAFSIFYIISWVVFIGLLFALPWMTKGGWTPVWGALTFPFGVFANVQVLALAKGYGTLAEAGFYLVLLIATPLTFYIIYRASMAWVTGVLSEKSGAAVV